MSDFRCPHCGSGTQSRGKHASGKSRYFCTKCSKWFQEEYKYSKAEETSWQEDGNNAVLTGKPQDKVPTLESLLRAFNVDEDTWKVESWKINQWDVSSSHKDRDTGEVIWSTKTNYQAKASLIRGIPTKHLWPTVEGATVPSFSSATRPGKPRKSLRRAVILSDMHVGYKRDFKTGKYTTLHDLHACNLAMDLIKRLAPEQVILVGDALDLADWSTHYLVSPEFAMTTQMSIDWLGTYLAELRKHCNDIYYLGGNHEQRMTDAIIKNSVVAYGLRVANMPDSEPVLSIPFLLGLDKMDIIYYTYPDGEHWINDNLSVIHGIKFGSKSGQTATKLLENARYSTICGHVHRLETASHTVWHRGQPIIYTAASIGTLAHIDGRVPHGGSSQMNWQQGFAVVDYDEYRFDVKLIPIENGELIYDGVVYS